MIVVSCVGLHKTPNNAQCLMRKSLNAKRGATWRMGLKRAMNKAYTQIYRNFSYTVVIQLYFSLHCSLVSEVLNINI